MRRINQMKYINIVAILALVMVFNCQDEDKTFGPIVTPTNLEVNVEIEGQDDQNPDGDGSGVVNFKISADGALAYRMDFGDASDVQLAENGEVSHRYVRQGVNTYIVTAIASGTGGVTSSVTLEITVFSAFDDKEVRAFLTGAVYNSETDEIEDITEPVSKTWYVASASNGHLGVGPSVAFDIEINGGPSQFFFPAFFAAPPKQYCDPDDPDFLPCFYTDELTFTLQPDSFILTYDQNNNGETFFNGAHTDIVGGGGEGCYEFDTSGTSVVGLAPSAIDWSQLPEDATLVPRETRLLFSGANFMSYYVSASEYEILEISEDALYVRCDDGLDANLSWYFRFSTSPASCN